MGWFGKFWNECNEYQLPKALLKQYNQFFCYLNDFFKHLKKLESYTLWEIFYVHLFILI